MKKTFTGKVEARRTSNLSFEFTGRIIKLYVDEGNTVGKGQIIAELDKKTLLAKKKQAVASLNQAKARLKLAITTLQRITNAIKLKAISQQALDEARQNYAVQKANVKYADSAVHSINVDLQKTVIRCPFNAVVAQRYLDEGHVVTSGQNIYKIVERRALEIRVGIPQTYLRYFKPKNKYTLRTQKRSLTATCKSILPVTEDTTRTIDVIFTLPKNSRMLVGELVSVSLRQSFKAKGVWISLNTMTEGIRGLWQCYVAVALPEKEVSGATHVIKAVQVDIIHKTEKQAYVRGLVDSSLLVTEGIHRIVAGQKVTIKRKYHE